MHAVADILNMRLYYSETEIYYRFVRESLRQSGKLKRHHIGMIGSLSDFTSSFRSQFNFNSSDIVNVEFKFKIEIDCAYRQPFTSYNHENKFLKKQYFF